MRERYGRRLDELVSSKPALAAHRECLINAMDGICVRGNYVPQYPDSLIDINIREYGHLIRITDSVAEFFYRLHCAVKPHFTSSVESDTMENCLDIVKKNSVVWLLRFLHSLSQSGKSARYLFLVHKSGTLVRAV